jgi:hypothetical protein
VGRQDAWVATAQENTNRKIITPTDIVVSLPPVPTGRQTWGAVVSMALCVALLIASGFMPIRLLTPIATDLHATEGMAGQAAQYRQGRSAAGFVMLSLHAFEDLGGHGVLKPKTKYERLS